MCLLFWALLLTRSFPGRPTYLSTSARCARLPRPFRVLGIQTWAPVFAQQALYPRPLPCPGSKFGTFSFVPSSSPFPTSHIFLVNLHLSIKVPFPCHAHTSGSTKGLSSWQDTPPPMSGTWVCEAQGSAIHAAVVGLERCPNVQVPPVAGQLPVEKDVCLPPVPRIPSKKTFLESHTYPPAA